MNGAVEKKVKFDLACQAATPKTKREPVQIPPLPTSPWLEISIDFKELSIAYQLVVTDDYLRYPVVDIMHTAASKIVIPHLEKTFAEFGVPEVVRVDNGPSFNGKEFKVFGNALGFKHYKVTPLWSRANGEVERFTRTLKKIIEAGKTEHRRRRRSCASYCAIIEQHLILQRETPSMQQRYSIDCYVPSCLRVQSVWSIQCLHRSATKKQNRRWRSMPTARITQNLHALLDVILYSRSVIRRARNRRQPTILIRTSWSNVKDPWWQPVEKTRRSLESLHFSNQWVRIWPSRLKRITSCKKRFPRMYQWQKNSLPLDVSCWEAQRSLPSNLMTVLQKQK